MSKGVKIMMGIHTETADLGYWELTDSRLTVGEQEQDKTMSSECGWQCGNVWGHRQWDKNLFPVLQLAFWSPFSLMGYLAQPRYRGGAWSCLRVKKQTLLIPDEKPYPLQGEDGSGLGGREQEEESENQDWYV